MSPLSELHYVLSEHTPFSWQWKALLNYERSVTHCGCDGWLADSAHCSWVAHAHTEQEAMALSVMLYINTSNTCANHHLTTKAAHYQAVSKTQLNLNLIYHTSMLLMYNHIHCHSRCTAEHLTMPSGKVQHCNIVSSDRVHGYNAFS